MDTPLFLLSAIVFLPALGALALAFIPGNRTQEIRWFTLVLTLLVLVLCTFGLLMQFSVEEGAGQMPVSYTHLTLPTILLV